MPCIKVVHLPVNSFLNTWRNSGNRNDRQEQSGCPGARIYTDLTDRRNDVNLTQRHPKIIALTTAGFLALGGAAATTATTTAAPVGAGPDVPEPAPSPEAQAATQAAVNLTPPSPAGPWTTDGADTGAYQPFLPFSAIRINTAGGTGSSPQQVALFAGDRYIGTTTAAAYPNQQVVRVEDNIIQVDYLFLQAGDSNAQPTGVASSRYILNPDETVTREGELPPPPA
jgi:hypothetical protein